MPTNTTAAIIVNSLGFEIRAKQLLDFIVIKYEPKIANYIPASSQLMIVQQVQALWIGHLTITLAENNFRATPFSGIARRRGDRNLVHLLKSINYDCGLISS